MLISVRAFVLIVLANFALCQTAIADTAAEAAAKWGLLGAWMPDCAKPASRKNAELTYVVRQGKLFKDRDYGDGRDSSEVISTTILPDGAIEHVVKYESLGLTRRAVDVKDSEGRKRTLINEDLGSGRYVIKDGRFLSNGAASIWLSHCK